MSKVLFSPLPQLRPLWCGGGDWRSGRAGAHAGGGGGGGDEARRGGHEGPGDAKAQAPLALLRYCCAISVASSVVRCGVSAYACTGSSI